MIGIIGFFFVFGALVVVRKTFFSRAVAARVDLQRIVDPDAADQTQHVNRDPLHLLGRLVVPLLSPVRRRALEAQLAAAGNPDGWTAERIVGMQVLLTPLLVGLGALRMVASPDGLSLMVMVIGGFIGFVGPPRLMSLRAEKRQAEIRVGLADVVDQLSVMVRAGMSLDNAFVRISTTVDGALADELGHVVQDIRMGVQRRDALKTMAERVQLDDLDVFVRSLTQSDELGIPIADTLQAQAEDMRLRRRQHAEETAMKLPVKVLMPTMICILPALLIVVIGPAIMSVIEGFG